MENNIWGKSKSSHGRIECFPDVKNAGRFLGFRLWFLRFPFGMEKNMRFESFVLLVFGNLKT